MSVCSVVCVHTHICITFLIQLHVCSNCYCVNMLGKRLCLCVCLFILVHKRMLILSFEGFRSFNEYCT